MLGGIVLVALALTGCTSGGDDKEPTKKSAAQKSLERDDTAVKPAWTLEAPVVGEPAAIGGVVVAVTTAPDDGLALVAADAASGKKLWTSEYSPGSGPTGIALSPDVMTSEDGKPYVARIRALSSYYPGWSVVEVLDAKTGDKVLASEQIYPVSRPDTCLDGTDVCVRAYDEGGEDAELKTFRLDLEKRSTGVDDDGLPEGARELGSGGLFSTEDRPGEELGVVRDGKVVWQTPVDEIFGKGYISDAGWSFHHDPETDILSGQVFQDYIDEAKAAEEKGEDFAYDLGKDRLVGLDGKTGRVLWTRDGATNACADITDGVAYDDTKGPVRCVSTGTRAFVDDELVYTDLVTTVEGYDARSGKTQWSKKLTAESAQALLQGEGVVLGDGSTMVIATKKGRELVSTKDGSSVPLKASARFLCATETEKVKYAMPGRKAADYYGEGPVTLCDHDGKAVDGDMTVSALRDGALAATETLHVIATKDGLAGYDLPAAD
jgi:outer membrane protein assembly factor BamB